MCMSAYTAVTYVFFFPGLVGTYVHMMDFLPLLLLGSHFRLTWHAMRSLDIINIYIAAAVHHWWIMILYGRHVAGQLNK